MKNVTNVSWRVVHHHKLPDWLKDNEHLLYGHRVPLSSYRACFESMLRIHTETGNIWTHLLGMVLFICIATYTLCSRYWDWMWQDITVHSVFFAGAIICLTFSWLFHTVSCHSQAVEKLFRKLDDCGIVLLIIASQVPFLYYAFYCQTTTRIPYLSSIFFLGTVCMVASFWDKFAEVTYKPARAGPFIALALTGVVPVGHFVMMEGLGIVVERCLGFVWAASLYVAGVLVYAFKIPESLYPGRFDIWFQSHQIFHVCVVLAALAHFLGVNNLADLRLHVTICPAQ